MLLRRCSGGARIAIVALVDETRRNAVVIVILQMLINLNAGRSCLRTSTTESSATKMSPATAKYIKGNIVRQSR